MRAVSVTLPESLAQKTEVLRTALRFLFAVEGEEVPLELFQFSKKPLNEIESGLRAAGHSAKFVDSVVDGLKKSSVYGRGLKSYED